MKWYHGVDVPECINRYIYNETKLFVPGSGGRIFSSLELAWSLPCDRTPSSELFTGVDMAPGFETRSSSRLRWLQHTEITP